MRTKAAPKDPLAAALALLARRPYSVAELRRALQKKFPSSPDLPQVIARLRQLGYLNDRALAESYALSLARNRSYGPHRVRRELRTRQVDTRTIEPAVEKAFESVDELELLERTLDKKIRTLRKPFTRQRLASLCQSLMRRGFRASDIMKVVRARPELEPMAADVDPQELEGLGNER